MMSSLSAEDEWNADQLELHARVETLDGNRGFCRYVGPVVGQTGIWVGVEWDDQTRGKHDGCHDGKRYFECKRKQTKEGKEENTRASFVRVQKVAPSTDFVSAAKDKYELESQEQLEPRLVFGTNKKSGGDDNIVEDDLTIELKTKASLQKSLKELERILLPNARLEMVTRGARTDEGAETTTTSSSSTEEEEVLANTFNMNATHVDVSGNLMKSFVELGKIGKYFRNLEILDASDSYYDEDVCNIESSGDAPAFAKEITLAASQFGNLKTLALNKTRTSWEKALLIIEQMPNLEELRLDRNGLQNIALVDERASLKFPKLKVLSLDGNKSIKWEDIWALRSAKIGNFVRVGLLSRAHLVRR